ncbi:MAG: NUDIX hydrolase [Paracoccaceae bacterium]
MTDAPTAPPIDKTQLRDAASLIILRHDAPQGPAVLMGQRGAGAAFMPSKYVFPGGALDAADWHVPLAEPLSQTCARRLAVEAPDGIGPALAVAAIRELWEETGLILGAPGSWPEPPAEDWATMAALGYRPSATPLRFVFRAITPKGRPRRFDARFFLADVNEIAGDPDDFSRACDELSHLHWVPLTEARQLNLPFITEVVLAEVQAMLAGGRLCDPESLPFFDNRTERATFRRIA